MKMLVFISMLCMLLTLAWSERFLNVYSNNFRTNEYCLLYYIYDAYGVSENYIYFDVISHQIIPYCFQLLVDNNFNNDFDSKFTFNELQKQNVTSQQLLSWSSSIDQAEQYEMFLNGIFLPLFDNKTLAHNCTSPWFGPHCRFAFNPLSEKSIDQMVDSIMGFNSKRMSDRTCYKHLNCRTFLSCLNWRDICDDKIDCIDGSDEINCWQLEINECTENEFRCQNGQCIPKEFFFDDPIYADCMDETDESYMYKPCLFDPTFACEEHTCPSQYGGFFCGHECCKDNIGRNFYRYRPENFRFDDYCSNSMLCLITEISFYPKACEQICPNLICPKTNCSMLFEFPPYPVLFGHVKFVFINKQRHQIHDENLLPDYICYDYKRCSDFLLPTISFNNSGCRHQSEFQLGDLRQYTSWSLLLPKLRDIFRKCLITIDKQFDYTNQSNIYHCLNSSKWISKHRLVDGIHDCPMNDDETFNSSCSLDDVQYRLKCFINGTLKCLSIFTSRDHKKDCDHGEDEYSDELTLARKHIYFQTICDGVQELLPILINGQYETDETNCEHWQCNNTYTRCDDYWSCPNGADEIHCSPRICQESYHKCVFPNDPTRISCLHINRTNDGIVDCLGGTDEPTYCRKHYSNLIGSDYKTRFHCWNDTKCVRLDRVCSSGILCPFNDDKVFCKNELVCVTKSGQPTDPQHIICALDDALKRRIVHFKLDNMPTYGSIERFPQTTIQLASMEKNLANNLLSNGSDQCNRGLSIRIQMTNDTHQLSCLCPPAYYGETCQYQNQRVSLILKIRANSNWQTTFTFLIRLFDNEGNIESYDYVYYQSIRECNTKFNINLLYSTRPKNLSKNYFIQIDKFDISILEYQGSWIHPIQFSFLPVNLLSILLIIPIAKIEPRKSCSISCLHGHCFSYVNNPNLAFCYCKSGWTGRACDIKYSCKCASGSICVSDSICVCPIDRYGRYCYLLNRHRDPELCLNGGQYLLKDQRYTKALTKNLACICPEEYSGDRCQYRQTQIQISFDNRIKISTLLFVHLITARNKSDHIQRSIPTKILFDETSIKIYISFAFHIGLAQINHDYYLIILNEKDIISSYVHTTVLPAHRCLPISEIFNETLVNWHLLKRIKYYYIPCQKDVNLICFYDSTQICLCDLSRQVNCFEFNHTNMSQYKNNELCQNSGNYFQDYPTCPMNSFCVCLNCYFGSQCQITSKQMQLSLDLILMYRIFPNKKINQQPIIIQIAITITTIVLCLGFVNGFLSIVTFRTKKACAVGCGFYLYFSSIISIIISSFLIIKLWLFILIQINFIQTHWFIYGQCMIIDYFLQCLSNMSDWMSACVAIERVINVSQGVQFNKIKSKQTAKRIIGIIIFITLLTRIHDPIHRQLMYDEEREKRLWCIAKYSLEIRIYDLVIIIIHFTIPLLINFITGWMIIFTATRIRSNAQKKLPYKQILHEQFRLHRHLLISPLIVILLGISRLIFSFLSGCMKSAEDSWFYLIGYIVAFLPSISTFLIFILPSETYKKEFFSAINRH